MKKIVSGTSALTIRNMMLFAFFLVLPLSVHAAVNETGVVELSPFLGYNFFQPPQNLNSSFLYGARASYNFSRVFGLEGTLQFANTSVYDETITGSQEGQFRYPIRNVNIFFYNIDAVFTLLQVDDFNFFVLGGFGAVNYNPSIETADMTTFELGIGAKYWFSNDFGLRLDVRDDMVSEVFYENLVLANSYHNINTTAGVVFAFGGEAKKKEAAREAAAEVIYVAEEKRMQERLERIGAQPTEEDKTFILAFEDVHFQYDKSTLTPEAKEVIKTTILKMKVNPKNHIRIAGYTSAAGTDDYNMKLSQRRAKVVEDYLVEEGLVTQDRLSTIGYGDTRPEMHEAAPSHHYSTAAKANMRVLFEVVVK